MTSYFPLSVPWYCPNQSPFCWSRTIHRCTSAYLFWNLYTLYKIILPISYLLNIFIKFRLLNNRFQVVAFIWKLLLYARLSCCWLVDKLFTVVQEPCSSGLVQRPSTNTGAVLASSFTWHECHRKRVGNDGARMESSTWEDTSTGRAALPRSLGEPS